MIGGLIGCLFLGLVIGAIAGMWLARRLVTKEKFMAIAQQSQHLLYAYLAADDVFRTKYLRFMRTDPGVRYINTIMENVAGVIFKLPIEDKKEMENIISAFGDAEDDETF